MDSNKRSSKLKAKKRQQKRRSLQSSLDRNNSEIILQTVCSDINLIENASQSYAAKSGENVLSSKESFLDLNIDLTDTSSDSSANFSPPKLIADIQSAYFYSDSSESSDISDDDSSANFSHPKLISDIQSAYLYSDSSKSSDISDEENVNIAEFLKQWYHDSNSVSMDALSSLLKGLKRWFPQLPATARTLLKTPRNVETVKMGEGEYFNFGLVKSVTNRLDKMINNNAINQLHLNFNIDGLPLYKSTNQQFWPLLCSIQEDCERKPFLVSIFCGNSKPPLEQFLSNFIEELNKILEEGFMYGSTKINVSVRCISCDAPARSFIKCTKSHNAYYGCDRCIQRGEWSGRVIFPVTDAEERTDYSFRNLIQKDHHKSTSPLTELEIDMIHSFPQDYMHLILLGVMRKLISVWRLGDSTHWKKLSYADVDLIDAYLLKSRQYWCSDFNRKPRSLCSADRWKATEYRSFLLYLGPVCLKSVLPKGIYYHFLLLFCAVSILVSDKLHQRLNDYAQSYLRHFCELADRYYGKEFLVYNVHSLIHISKDALHFGPLDSFSCFNFENFLGSLKHMLSKTNQPLQQVIKRIMEKNTWEKDMKQTPNDNQTLSVTCTKYPSEKPNCGIEGVHLTKVQWGTLSLSTKTKDSCVITEKGNVFKIENIVQASDKSVHIIGKKYTDKTNFFTYPCHSSELDIYRVKKLKTSCQALCMTSVRMKAVLLPYKNDLICMPIRHTETWKDDI